jgi:hypothetical protein
LQAGLGFAVTEIQFAVSGDVNGFNLVVGPGQNVNFNGVALQSGSSVLASFNGQQLSISAIDGNMLLSQPGSNLGGSVAAVTFQNGGITSLSGNATIYGFPVPWTSNSLTTKLNENPSVVAGLSAVQNFLGKCIKKP